MDQVDPDETANERPKPPTRLPPKPSVKSRLVQLKRQQPFDVRTVAILAQRKDCLGVLGSRHGTRTARNLSIFHRRLNLIKPSTKTEHGFTASSAVSLELRRAWSAMIMIEPYRSPFSSESYLVTPRAARTCRDRHRAPTPGSDRGQ